MRLLIAFIIFFSIFLSAETLRVSEPWVLLKLKDSNGLNKSFYREIKKKWLKSN